ncbi:MAG TPA: TonB-dependent receptor, partial [Sphaerochaeta sp.]|nr:TonB-dependent receptor [Sphaerochaeta sp.]
MKKRGIFSLVLVLVVLYPTFATSPFIDFGSAYELTVFDEAFADAETNSASTVTIISREQIDSFNAQTTSELVGKAIGTSFSSYGGLGAAQSVQIRGASASKTLVYVDGMPLTSAFDGVFDLSSIPVALIERIEIVKSGAGNLGKTNAIGGIVHIITKKTADTA